MSLALELLFDDQALGEEEDAAPELQVEEPPLGSEKGVVLTYRSPLARSVQLAGDFNNWVPDKNVETRQGPDLSLIHI